MLSSSDERRPFVDYHHHHQSRYQISTPNYGTANNHQYNSLLSSSCSPLLPAALLFGSAICAIALLSTMIGMINLHNCPIQQFIPIWLIVFGVVGLFGIASIVLIVGGRRRYQTNMKPTIEYHSDSSCSFALLLILLAVVVLFAVGWLLGGLGLVYDIWSRVQSTNRHQLITYCDQLTFRFASMTIIVGNVAFICAGIGWICCGGGSGF
jgi:hypothetical protein